MSALRAFEMALPVPRLVTLPTVPLFGLRVVSAAPDAVIEDLLTGGAQCRVAFVNAHCANVMARDPAYAAALQTAGRVLPDGIGVEQAARMNGVEIAANLNGTDFVPQLLRGAAARGRSVFLFGAAPGVAAAAAARLVRDIPTLRIAGHRDGFDGAADTDAAIADINASGADILLVALGVPAQDVWLDRHADRLHPGLTLGVGALFDFLGGQVVRAPAPVRRARLEWLWRLAQEPRRLAGRYLLGNLAFLLREGTSALRERPDTQPQALAKRALDVTLSGAALVALAPLLALTALAIRLDSRGPVLFRQTRVGRDGRPFTILKFRSMHIDAEARRAALLAQSDREGICFKARHDPRITRVGRILRRFSIDELPQILNILRGEMSIVGPRPALPEEVAAYPARALGRLTVKPGLTGIWQVSGRAEIGFDRMVDMDLAYARSRSFLLDLVLIAMTFRAVVSGRGAY
ncbi:UDP-phosphate galactose phosphotransferase [Rhodobaculum claviforme]|uniref:UDP-phosphate galactose phosphotransferase n=2 Tax=Rhodobaculum claviforme TaxID=1549854 RepID=A0A934TGQ8_9RHOB|nr:WecB/TagA/CpsF family glycosyltransferase [Rhodobaculum claviforme]MBK5926134.1 UDP-phosphate galactose phosphotransferase [Rhodobaculum claviforme]